MTLTAPTLRLELFVPGVGPEVAFDRLVSELVTALDSIRYRFEPGPSGPRAGRESRALVRG
ncbi:MAG: hypothetical protein WCB19_08015 [Thermoplasmata archaeon]